jgi:hypothetical protein
MVVEDSAARWLHSIQWDAIHRVRQLSPIFEL